MHDDASQKPLGCFNDELTGCVMSEWVGLNPKYYAFNYQASIQKNQKEYQKRL